MSAALNIGTRALNANLASLQVIGHNIANANTAGYSRQSVQMQVSGYQTLGGNYFGKGVELGTVTRSHSAYLTREAQVASSMAAADSTRYSRLQQLESLFPTGQDGLGAALNDMLNAWSDVAASPTNLSARVVALARGEELAARLRDTAGEIDSLAYSAQQQARSTVGEVNRLANDLATINQRVIETRGSSGTPNDLLDQRDAILSELSRHVQLSTVAADDGTVNVFVAAAAPGAGHARQQPGGGARQHRQCAAPHRLHAGQHGSRICPREFHRVVSWTDSWASSARTCRRCRTCSGAWRWR